MSCGGRVLTMEQVTITPAGHTKICIIRQIQCHICFLSFETEIDRKEHEERVHNICHLCGEKSHGKSGLLEHLSSVHNSFQEPAGASMGFLLRCRLCPITCQDHVTLTEHVLRVHPTTTAKTALRNVKKVIFFKCLFCPLRFGDKKGCLQHQKEPHFTCHSENKYVCDKCDMSFESSEVVILHNFRIHGRTLENGCKFCGLKFSSYKKVTEHMARVHGNGTSHDTSHPLLMIQCDKCDMSFVSSQALTLHKFRVHEKTLAVGYTFSGLTFVCEFCGFTFLCKRDLTKHMSRGTCHDTRDKLACDKCDMLFKTDLECKQHFDIMHKIAFVKLTGIPQLDARQRRLDKLRSDKRDKNDRKVTRNDNMSSHHISDHPYACIKGKQVGSLDKMSNDYCDEIRSEIQTETKIEAWCIE